MGCLIYDDDICIYILKSKTIAGNARKKMRVIMDPRR
jgi:hypothetical protein